MPAAEPFPGIGFQITIQESLIDDLPCHEQEQTVDEFRPYHARKQIIYFSLAEQQRARRKRRHREHSAAEPHPRKGGVRRIGVWAYRRNVEIVGEASPFAPVSRRNKAGRFAYNLRVPRSPIRRYADTTPFVVRSFPSVAFLLSMDFPFGVWMI